MIRFSKEQLSQAFRVSVHPSMLDAFQNAVRLSMLAEAGHRRGDAKDGWPTTVKKIPGPLRAQIEAGCQDWASVREIMETALIIHDQDYVRLVCANMADAGVLQKRRTSLNKPNEYRVAPS